MATGLTEEKMVSFYSYAPSRTTLKIVLGKKARQENEKCLNFLDLGHKHVKAFV